MMRIAATGTPSQRGNQPSNHSNQVFLHSVLLHPPRLYPLVLAPPTPPNQPKKMASKTLWTRQPGFFVYTSYTIFKALVKLPFLMLLYTVPRVRPLREWTYQQALVRSLTRLVFEYVSVAEFSPIPSLDPGKEKDRFVTMDPFRFEPDQTDPQQTQTIYTGAAKPDPNGIKPAKIGGTWFPAALVPPNASAPTISPTPRRRVFLHFHGGAYVLFDCRDRDMAFGANLLLHASATTPSQATAAVLCPQYRLACHPHPSSGNTGSRFPAALQDAITAYAHLVLRLGVDARDVVLSGDSAGGNLALALLRYLCEEEVLPPPGGVLLWSPWTDPGVTSAQLKARKEDKWDIVPPGLVGWACRAFLPKSGCEEPYVSPVRRGIETEVPIWVQVGGRELIREDILRWVEVQKLVGKGRLRVFEIPNAPHDMFMAGEGLGFVKESSEAAEDAIRFLDGLKD